uniref:28S ribosomal protein S9, mitochondrial-like n=1 Tax=Styela clava TaxID=7725 RepID=UPI00193A2B4C|nr:28S ribosomal protein S9, mitochondrial-like [Styela clava]
MMWVSGSTCKISISAAMLAQKRALSTSAKCLRNLGNVQLRTQETNLQKTKHIKYSDEFLIKQAEKYKLNKRRLANMMGEDPDTYNDEDMKRSIRYLFPSDLDEEVLPSMEHPSKLYTSQLRIHWDENGRPLHYLYYSKKQNLNHLLHEIYQYIIDARKMGNTRKRSSSLKTQMSENQMEDCIEVDMSNEDSKKLNLDGTRWMTDVEISREILDGEAVTPMGYRQLIAQLGRLLEEENAFIAEDLIMKLRKTVPIVSMLGDVKEYEVLDDGTKCAEAEGIKKSAVAKVKLLSPGTGKITINEQPFLNYFTFISDRQTVLSPFCFLGLLEKYDVHATIRGGLNQPATFGSSHGERRSPFPSASQAAAMRLAIAKSLGSFLTPVEVEMLRRAGLLTQDKRWKERKVFGQHKARKKHTWKRR